MKESENLAGNKLHGVRHWLSGEGVLVCEFMLAEGSVSGDARTTLAKSKSPRWPEDGSSRTILVS